MHGPKSNMRTCEQIAPVALDARCIRLEFPASTKCRLQRAQAKGPSASIQLRPSSPSRIFRSRRSCRQRRKRVLDVKALVIFDYAQPALWLGTALIGGGVSLYNLRNVQPGVAKDSDVALSCILVFSGGILIFQGWRLDPLLLFVQICLAGTAFTWALEAIKLRKEVEQGDSFNGRNRSGPEIEDSRRRDRSFAPARNRLPAGAEESVYGQWYGEGGREEEFDFEEALPASSRGFYDGRGQASYPSSSGRYQSYDPADYGSYSQQPSYSEYPEEEGPNSYSRYDEDYQRRNQQGPSPQYDTREPNEDWQTRGNREDRQQRNLDWDEPEGDVYSQDQQLFDVYSQQESDFLPPDGEAVIEDDTAANNSRVMDEVASFYNRPESVVEDVQKFYDDRGQLTEGALEDLENQSLEEQEADKGNQGYEGEWQNQEASNGSSRQTRAYSRQDASYNEPQPRYRQRN